MLPVLLAELSRRGFGLIADAVIAKGQQEVESRLGIKLPEVVEELTPELRIRLAEVQNANKKYLLESALEAERIKSASQANANTAVTDRWKADTGSDVKIAKVVRPAILIYLTAFFSIATIAVMVDTKYTVPAEYLSIFKELLMMVFEAYFIGRSAEKGINLISAAIASRGK
jgi:hypothetical protein